MSWFKVPRNILRKGSILTRPNDVIVLVALLSRAQWKEGPITYKGRDCWLKEGEVCVSQNDLATMTELSRNQIRLILDRFKRSAILTQANHQAGGQANHQAGGQANHQGNTTEVPIYYIDLEPVYNPRPPSQEPSEPPSQEPSEPPSKSPSTHQVPTNRPRDSEGLDSPPLPFSQGRVEAPARKNKRPDPDRFSMSASWTMSGEFYKRMEAAYRHSLGEEKYWRQIARFIEHHTQAGTLGTQSEHEKRLQGWLRNADRNIEHG